MKILLIGSGGREHALAWKIAQSKRVTKLYAAPGNPGIASLGECVDIADTDIKGLLNFAREKKIDLTVVGPEAPLSEGIVDIFTDYKLRIFGPRKKSARLESSKVFAKKLMLKYNIPTADFRVFDSFETAKAHVQTAPPPFVVKAEGLAAGKGVLICPDEQSALEALQDIMLDKKFGAAGKRVVIEEMIQGEEASVLAFTDGKTIAPLVTSQDHKRVFDNDQGPNTGGMGAYTPAPVVTDTLMERIISTVLVPTVHAMNHEECAYSGMLYAGIMLTRNGIKVLEFNCRFGDPETQPIMVRLKSDIVDIFEATIDGKLDKASIDWEDGASVCVVAASGGYPGEYEKGKRITGIAQAEETGNTAVFHAGTAADGKNIVTSGGRVLGITSWDIDVQSAIDRAYQAIEHIEFEGIQYRKDIGQKALRHIQ